MENQKNLKWISLVSLGTMVILLLNYAFAGGYSWTRQNFLEAWSFGLTLAFLFFNVLAISVSTLFSSGIRSATVCNTARSLFVVSMLFFFLALISALARGPNLTFTFS
jgi:hypothetical protein